MPLTYREQFYKAFDIPKDESLNLKEIADLSGIKKSILQQVYNRGTGAWKSNISSVRLKGDFSKNPDTKRFPRSARLSKEQWSYARVYSFIMGGKTWWTADSDLAAKVGTNNK
jgi:hypothetical protein